MVQERDDRRCIRERI
jgi:hypothetical protein